MTGAATVVAPSLLGMHAESAPRAAHCRRTSATWRRDVCNITAGAGKVPFICFDLAGGANIVGSNVLVGKEGGQLDFLSTQGYSKQGLPGDMLPNNATTNFINTELGLAFHSRQRVPARHSREDFGDHARQHQRRGHRRRVPRTTPATILTTRCTASPKYGAEGRTADADRLAELRFRRQLDGARDADGSGQPSDQDRSHERRDRPGRHRRARQRSFSSRRRHRRGHGIDGAHQQCEAAVTYDTGLAEQRCGVEDQVRCGYVKTADTVEKFSDPAALNPSIDPRDHRRRRRVRRELRQRPRVREDRRGDEAGGRRLCRRRHDQHGRLRLSHRRSLDRRDARPARRPLHGRVPGIRGAHAASRSCSTCSATARCHRTAWSTIPWTVAARASGPATTSRLPPRSSSSTARIGRPALLNEAGIPTSASSAAGLLPRATATS